ncbi:alpha/beta hydrolase [Peptoniphilus equinus]|uniref:Alpha/beta hydrolase n=1 Tax=Peptoniphilus equinus TaxID=3016343 RepID=A0ABY7QUX7_9FIRM|nr:alpha/beta hydrolase [Peptoniphilus equinus]WBW49840.1 alpha/beta hydrolase [Peptoniphilus equinus]
MTYVFIHGLGQTSSSWDKVITHLPTDIPIYRPSLSDMVKGKQMTYQNLYNTFESECTYMKMPLHLCGISLGAILALQYTLYNPQKVASVILIAPQYKMPRLLLRLQNIMFHALPQRAFRSTAFSKRDTIALTTSMKEIDFTALLKKITCPAFIVCGQKDRANQNAARNLANTMPNATLCFVEGAGHEVNIEAPIALAYLIKDAWFYA